MSKLLTHPHIIAITHGLGHIEVSLSHMVRHIPTVGKVYLEKLLYIKFGSCVDQSDCSVHMSTINSCEIIHKYNHFMLKNGRCF